MDWGTVLMGNLKLQWKIFAFLLGFCTLLLVILWLFQTVFLNDMYKYVRTKEIDSAIELVKKNIDNADLNLILEDLEVNKDIIVKLKDEFRPPEPVEPYVDTRPGFTNRRPFRTEFITKEITFALSDGRTATLVFHAIITPVFATVSTLQLQLYIITIIMVMLAVALAFIIARRVAKPIVDLNDSAKYLANGNYDVVFSGKGFLEIAELSDTLNTAAAELSKVENLRRELMANISHDLRTPLALIYSYAEVMHDFQSEITPQQTQIIMEETKRLTSLVNDVLNLSQLETKVMEISEARYNLTDELRKTIKNTAELIKKDGYSIVFNFTEEIEIIADKVKITQAFYNLLINAITHTGADKIVTVTQTAQNGKVKVEVCDSGDGIDADDLPYIWERYYKVDKNHKRPVTGTGLGLSIVKKIIDLSGGVYGVESQLGVGSTFWFSLNI